MSTSGPIRKFEEGTPEYSNGKLLSTGKVFSVYRFEKSGRYVAVKSMNHPNSSGLILLRREFDIASRLNHPCIAEHLSFDEDTPVGPAIVQEYIEGRGLQDFLAERPTVKVRRKVFSQILDAVDYLHKKGIVHNDLKPENILITSMSNDVRVIDFGLADTDSHFLSRHLGGTEGTSAPEVMAGSPDSSADSRSDIYSLGIILSQMFPNRHYSRIVNKCLATEITYRFSSVGELASAIHRRDTGPLLFCLFAVVAVAVCFVLIQIMHNRRSIEQVRAELETVIDAEEKEKTEKDAVVDSAAIIRSYLESLADEAERHILNPDEAPYWEFGNAIYYSHYHNKAIEYSQSIQNPELKYICDTISCNRLSIRLAAIYNKLPFIWDAYKQGLISEEECRYYNDLASQSKPFSPFKQ